MISKKNSNKSTTTKQVEWLKKWKDERRKRRKMRQLYCDSRTALCEQCSMQSAGSHQNDSRNWHRQSWATSYWSKSNTVSSFVDVFYSQTFSFLTYLEIIPVSQITDHHSIRQFPLHHSYFNIKSINEHIFLFLFLSLSHTHIHHTHVQHENCATKRS